MGTMAETSHITYYYVNGFLLHISISDVKKIIEFHYYLGDNHIFINYNRPICYTSFHDWVVDQ